MCSSESKSLGVSRHEVKAALACERRRGVRRRLVAIGKILAGKSIKHAARAAKATRGSVERWLKHVRQAGLEPLLRDRRRRYRKREMTPAQVEETRREIAAALKRRPKPHLRSRLVAIDMVLPGGPINDAAAGARERPNTVRAWLRVVTYDGIARTLARWEGAGARVRPRLVDADPVSLRELAAKEKNPRVRKRMLALACVAEGMGPLAASIATRLDHNAVLRTIRRFREEGIEALYDGAPFGRRQRLSQDQLQELRAEILQRPDLGYRQLGQFVAARFGVRYSLRGLRLLLNRELGIVCRRRRFTETSPTVADALAGKDLAQHLNPDELRAALARTKDRPLRRKLIALLQLAQGWEPERVAFQVGAAPETLGNWVALYHRLGAHALHPTSRNSP